MTLSTAKLKKNISKALVVIFVILGVIMTSNPLAVQSKGSGGNQFFPNSQSTEEAAEFSNKVFLPGITKHHQDWINVDRIWTVDLGENERVAYLPGEPIAYFVGGSNYTGQVAATDISWTQTGPCVPTTVYTGTLSLAGGPWEELYLSSSVPECAGIYTHTLQVSHKEQITTLTTRFVVNDPSAVVLSDEPAFDKCGIPNLDEMKTWMDKSPYWGVNIYIGGIHRGCANYGLDAFWVHEVSKQGWKLIPTWVGPQAPCSKFKYKISSDPDEAYIEGKIEADGAYLAADRLGLMGHNIIYYDLEGFWGADLDCREAAKSFLRGWVERLHEYGLRAGAYGSSCSSYMTDWASNNPIPDNVWIADWTTIPFAYDPEATVWGARCLDDSLWANHQRIKQYAGDHVETWGEVSLGIDSNIADGELAIIPSGPLTQKSSYPQSPQLDSNLKIESFQLLSPDQGWIKIDQQGLLWTEDGGSSWEDITPETDSGEHLMAAHFVDTEHGWAISRSLSSGKMSLYRTEEGGSSWHSSILELASPDIGAAYLNFIDTSTGWLTLKFQTSSNFNLGLLYKTDDGGKSWEQLSMPIGEPVHFIDAERGWVVGGVEEDELYVTDDGGSTWRLQKSLGDFSDLDADSPGSQPSISFHGIGMPPDVEALENLPSGVVELDFVTSDFGWALVQNGICSGSKPTVTEIDQGTVSGFHCEIHSSLQKTTDGGRTWTKIIP